MLIVPIAITPEVMRLALVKLAESYDDGRKPERAWAFALEYAAEVGRRLATARDDESDRCAEWDEILP